MATRFYFPASSPSSRSPSFEGWDETGEATRHDLSATKGSSAITAGTRVGPWTSNNYALDRQWLTPPLAAQTLASGSTVDCMVSVREYANADNVNGPLLAINRYNSAGVWQESVFATAVQTGAATTEFINNATHRSCTFANGLTVGSDVTISAGDYLTVEIGFTDTSGGSTPEASAKWGEDATDATLGDNTTTADRAGWVEFSQTLSILNTNGSLSATLGALTVSSSGTVAAAAVTGTLAATLGTLTASAAGTVLVEGTTSATLGALTVSASGAVDVQGSTSATLGTLTASAAGAVAVEGTTSATLGTLTVSASGVVGSSPVTGTTSATLGTLTASAAGTVLVEGTTSATLGTLTVSASGVVGSPPVTGTTSATLGALTASAAGTVLVEGTTSATLGTLTASATGAVLIEGAAAFTFGALTASAAGTVDVAGSVSAALGALTLSAAGTVDAYVGPSSGSVTATLGALTSTGRGKRKWFVVSNYSISFSSHYTSISTDVAIGDVVARSSSGGYVTADAAAIAAGGVPVAIALTQPTVRAPSAMLQYVGEVDSSIVDLAPGDEALARVGSDGRIERVTTPDPSDWIVGLVDVNGNVSLSFEKARRVRYGTAAPVSGTWTRGTQVLNVEPSAGGTVGWVCVSAGTPGTWKAFGSIEA